MGNSSGPGQEPPTSSGSTRRKQSRSSLTDAPGSIRAGSPCLWPLIALREFTAEANIFGEVLVLTVSLLPRGGKRITFAPYGKVWRNTRSVFHKASTPGKTSGRHEADYSRLQVLTQKMAEDYSVIQMFEAKQLSVDLLDKPNDFYMHNRRYAASVIMQVTYGWRIPECKLFIFPHGWRVALTFLGDCPEIHRIFQVLGRFVQCRKPGQWLVDVFPALATNPVFNMLSSWKRVGSEFHALDDAIWQEFWDQMKRKVQEGTAPHCFGKVLQADYEKQGLTESQSRWIW